MQKAKKYDWKDSNLALFGSDTERKVKKDAAKTEPAWEGAGKDVGIQIWRIVKFKVKDWPENQYGEFYNGDSYIILNTYKEKDSEELLYDVHFWIGQYSTQDEYGTAAYKTVELDTLLDDKPIQHREVMGHESDLFKGYFKELKLLDGGADTGFRHVKPQEYKPRLLHFHGDRKGVTVVEKSLNRKSLDSSDVFILDNGLELIQWNGNTCNKDEKFKAVQFVNALKSERGGKPTVESVDEREISENHKFYTALTEEYEEDEGEESEDFSPSIFRVSDETGSMEMSLVAEGNLKLNHLDSKDVFIVDTGKEVFVRIGKDASADEKRNAMPYAHSYLMKTKHPLVPVTCLSEGKETSAFLSVFK